MLVYSITSMGVCWTVCVRVGVNVFNFNWCACV